MNLTTPLALALAMALTLPAPAPAADLVLDDLAWMSGYWTNGTTMEELWLAPAGGMMIGVHRDVFPDKVFFEYLRIEQRDDGVYYVARPSNQPAAEFRMVDVSGTHARFDNFAHDFPHVISYLLSGDSLVVTISGGVGEEYRDSKWIMKRSRLEEKE